MADTQFPDTEADTGTDTDTDTDTAENNEAEFPQPVPVDMLMPGQYPPMLIDEEIETDGEESDEDFAHAIGEIPGHLAFNLYADNNPIFKRRG